MKRVRNSLSVMFGFIFRQSIVQTLIDFRIVSILSILAGGWFVWELWVWYSDLMTRLLDENKELPRGWDVAFLGFAGAALTAFWKAVTHIQENVRSHRPDDTGESDTE